MMTDRIYGEIPGNPTGTSYASRREAATAGVHRPLQAGICGGPDGAESVVVSGGYVDDFDNGDEIIYTGQGARDPDTRLQVANQELTRGNLGLARNCLEGLPVRVVRGHEGESTLSPVSGYRYDGLFYVADYWQEIGKDGYRIWRFRLVSSAPQPSNSRATTSVPASKQQLRQGNIEVERSADFRKSARIVRDLHDHTCQVCGLRLQTPAGPYALVVHIRATTAPHYGTHAIDNLLCLCPNDAVRFSTGAVYIDEACMVRESDTGKTLGKLRVRPNHKVDCEHIRYHREHYSGAAER
jgi:putative restriction endonuclease